MAANAYTTNTYDLGDLVRLDATFKNAAGTATDPTTITLRVRHVTGVPSTAYTFGAGEVTREAAGVFFKNLSFAKSGVWFYRWEGTGAVQQQEEKRVIIRASSIVVG